MKLLIRILSSSLMSADLTSESEAFTILSMSRTDFSLGGSAGLTGAGVKDEAPKLKPPVFAAIGFTGADGLKG